MITYNQIRAQYAKNAAGLAQMLAKAERTGKKVNGYTAADLRASVTDYQRLSTATDSELQAHFQKTRTARTK